MSFGKLSYLLILQKYFFSTLLVPGIVQETRYLSSWVFHVVREIS